MHKLDGFTVMGKRSEGGVSQNLFIIFHWLLFFLQQVDYVCTFNCTLILFLANSRCWMSVGQPSITVVSCLSWQSRYFSPASMYSLHSWVWRFTILALPLPLAWRPRLLSLPPGCGLPSDSDGCMSSRNRMVARRRMLAEGEQGKLLVDQLNLGRRLVGQAFTAVGG